MLAYHHAHLPAEPPMPLIRRPVSVSAPTCLPRAVAIRLSLAAVVWAGVAVWHSAPASAGNGEPGAAIAGRGLEHELWIAVRKDGKAGTGTPDDPLDGGSQPKFDAILHAFWKAGTKNITLHLGPGTFETVGSNVCMACDPAPGWRTDDGWKILGAGMGNTRIRLAGFSYVDLSPIDAEVARGVWSTREANGFQPGQELLLTDGKRVSGLELGRSYFVSEVVDWKRFRVSASFGGPSMADAAIGEGGRFQRVNPSAATCVISTNPWNKQDIEVRDMTIDCNWTRFGTTLGKPFTVPGDMRTVTVDVESSDWAQVHKWVYLQQTDYAPIGAYEVVAIPGNRRLVLRNLRHVALPPPQEGQPDLRFQDNAPPGTVVPRGTRVCPRLNVSGVGLSARRAKVERVRVTNVGCPIYEGPCGITVVGIGQPGPDWPQASEIVIRDCVVDDIWGQYGWIIQVHGNNVDWPSKDYGTQAIVEGNTIYGNGLHQGLGGWNYVNSFWINNKVVNCTASFFTDTSHCWNNVVKNNLFLQCKSYTVNLGGGCPAWKPETKFKPGDATLFGELYYGCKAAHAGHAPPDPAFWAVLPHQGHTGWNAYVFEGNVFEICDHSGPLLFNGNVANTIFRNNIVRYADGQGSGSEGLHFANPTNRGLIVTGNVIDSRLKNNVGKSIVFGKDNIDEKGRVRRELEFGERS